MNFPIPTRPCMSWCDFAEGQHEHEHPADRSCWSPLRKVPMTLAKPVEMSEREWHYDWLEVGLVRRGTRDLTDVLVHNEEAGIEWFLTVDEARHLCDHLTELLDHEHATRLARYVADNEGRTL